MPLPPDTGLSVRSFGRRPGQARQLALFTLLGAITALGQAPWDLAPLTLLGLALGLHLFARRARGAAGAGWAFGFGYFLLSLHWIVFPFLVEPDRYGWMAPFALVLLPAGLALYWAAAFALAGWLAPQGRTRRLLALAVTLTGAEVLRALALTGFPWVLLGHALIPTPFAQLAALAGPFGLTALIVGAAALLAALAGGSAAGRIGLAVPLALGALGWATLAPGPIPPAADAPVIRLVQPNAPQRQKWSPDFAPLFQQRLVELTASGDRPDLVVWPETAIPYLLEYSEPFLKEAANAARGAPVVIGINRREEARYYNSLVVVGPEGAPGGLYDKVHLVPFGEYFPFAELAARLGLHGLAASEGGGFTEGSAERLIDLPGIGPVRPLICYEGIFANEIAPGGERPRLMVLVTNDAWFGSYAGPLQHLAQARLRAIEQGVPMVRVANTGVSAMIDAHGRLIDALGMDEAGFRDVALPALAPPTAYARYGDAPVLWPLGAALLTLLALRRRFRIDPA